jgi:hypothetical protein
VTFPSNIVEFPARHDDHAREVLEQVVLALATAEDLEAARIVESARTRTSGQRHTHRFPRTPARVREGEPAGRGTGSAACGLSSSFAFSSGPARRW